MTVFEIILPFLVLALALLSGVVLFFALRVEKQLADRKKINLANYREKNHLFYITRDLPVAVFAGAVSALALVLTILALINPVIRIYAIALVFLLGVNGASAYFSLSRPKFTRDIRVFDAYYVRVDDMLAGKARTQSDIDACQYRVSELAKKLGGMLSGFNENLTVPINGGFLGELFTPIRRMLREFEEEIERFSGAIEEDFNRAIAAFLQNGEEPELQVVPVRALDEGTVDDLLAKIKTAYAARVGSMVIDQVNSGAVADARALGNIMTLFHKLGIKVDPETLARFLRAGAAFKDREVLAEMLYNNRQIPAQTVREVLIPEGMEWAFVPGMVAAFNTRELGAILTDLLAGDHSNMCYLLLSRFTGAHRAVLETALRAERERTDAAPLNTAARQAKAFLLILGTDYAVGNSANLHENLAMMLYDRRTELGFNQAEQSRIVSIVKDQEFWQARTTIAEMYGDAVRYVAPLAESATRVLLQYVMDPVDKTGFLSPERVAALLGEYRFTLSHGELATLRALLGAWMLCSGADAAAKTAVLREFVTLPYALEAPSTQDDDALACFGRRVLGHLAQKDRVRLRSVVYRTEQGRLALDGVRALCEKGE